MAYFTVETSACGYYHRIYEIEADNEEEAREEIEKGNGNLIAEDASDLDDEEIIHVKQTDYE